MVFSLSTAEQQSQRRQLSEYLLVAECMVLSAPKCDHIAVLGDCDTYPHFSQVEQVVLTFSEVHTTATTYIGFYCCVVFEFYT